jgi:hypothetical protein
MRKAIALLTIVCFAVMGFALVGCGKEEPVPVPTPPVVKPPPPPPPPQATPAPAPEPKADPGPPVGIKKGGGSKKPAKIQKK